jgi:hypothetical protein
MSTGAIVVIFICVGVIGGVVGFFVLRGLKGTIKIDCEKNTFDPGETIKGNIYLKIKKQTIGNKLTISLVADETTTYHDGDESRTEHDEVYRDDLVVEDKKSYPVGYEQTYDFALTIPAMNAPGKQVDGVVGAVFDALSVNRRKSKIEWQLEARLDAEGLDLVNKKDIHMRHLQTS